GGTRGDPSTVDVTSRRRSVEALGDAAGTPVAPASWRAARRTVGSWRTDGRAQHPQRRETTVMAKTVAELLGSTLADSGVRRVYGIVGDIVTPVTTPFRRNGTIDWIHVRNEEAGAFA